MGEPAFSSSKMKRSEDTPPTTPAATLADQLDKRPEESKKYSMTRFGLYCILGIFVASATLFLLKPDTAGQIVVLAQIVVGAVAGLVGIFCGAQATVDFKNSASLAAVVESGRKQDTEEQTNDEGDDRYANR